MSATNYYAVEATARLALERWRNKPHNAKWWKKIEGTPIPNDLIVCISEDIAKALAYIGHGPSCEFIKGGKGTCGPDCEQPSGVREPRLRELSAILEHDRTKVAEGVTAVKKAIHARDWLKEGRGPYEWDDDKWHTEFAVACTEILDALEPLARIAADWTNCPTKQEDIQAAREVGEGLREALVKAKRIIDGELAPATQRGYKTWIGEIDRALAAPALSPDDWLCSQPECGLMHSEHAAPKPASNFQDQCSVKDDVYECDLYAGHAGPHRLVKPKPAPPADEVKR